MAFKGDPEIQEQKGTNLGLDTKDLGTLCEELVEVRAKWRPIGLKLGLTPGTLDEIKQEKTNRLESVLLHWLRVTIGASWEQLIDALRSALVGEIRLAEKLELKYCLPEKTGHGEKREYRSDDEQQLTNDIKNIKKKFANLQTATRESLKKCNVELMSLVALLTSYRTSCAVIESERNMLLAHQQEDLRRAASVDEIFVIISPFSSFLDFEILEDVIEKFGAESNQSDLAKYFTELKQFLNTWKVEPCKISRLDDKKKVKFCFKLDTCSLAIYPDLKAAIARILKVPVYALHLHSIEDGSIQLIFFFLGIVQLSFHQCDQIAQIIPSVLKVSLIHGSTSEIIFERVINPVPSPEIRQEYTEEKGEKTIQESHEKKLYQRLFSWRTSQRAGEEAEPKTTPSPGETVEPTVTRVTKKSSESSTRGKRRYQRLFSRHSSRQELTVKHATGEEYEFKTPSPGETVEPAVKREGSFDIEVSPPTHYSPPREVSPPIHYSPPREVSPPIHYSPPRVEVSLPQVEVSLPIRHSPTYSSTHNYPTYSRIYSSTDDFPAHHSILESIDSSDDIDIDSSELLSYRDWPRSFPPNADS